MTGTPPDRIRWRPLGRTVLVVLLLAASASALATGGGAQDASTRDLDCAGSADGVVFGTDSGLEVTHDGQSLETNPYVNETTLSFPNLTVRATDNASLTVTSATERQVCLSAVAPTDASLLVSPSAGPTMVVEGTLDDLTYGAVDYDRSATAADLAYSAPAAVEVAVHGVPLANGTSVQAVDADSRAVLDADRVTENRTVRLNVPGDERSVDLRRAPAATTTQTATTTPTATPAGNASGSVGDESGSVSGDTATATPTPIPSASTGQTSGWTAELVDYQPSPKTTHVGGFLPLALLLGLLACWLLVTRDSRETTWLVVVLLTASARTTSDLLQVMLDGFVGLEASMAAINLLLELGLAVCFLQFAAVYANDGRLQTRAGRLGLATVGVLGTAAVLTNPLHGFVFTDAAVTGGSFTYVRTTAGPGGWAIFVLNTVGLVAGAGLLLRSLLSSPTGTVWRPVAVIGSGLCLALVIGVLSRLERGPVQGYDYTASGVNYFVLSTAVSLTAFGLSRFRERGRESVIAELDDPIVVLDDAWGVVEWNAAAEGLFPGVRGGRSLDALLETPLQRPAVGRTTSEEITVNTDEAASDHPRHEGMDADGGPAVAMPEPDGAPADGEVDTDARPGPHGSDRERHFVARATAVATEPGTVVGYAVQFVDVTTIKRQTIALEARNEQLGQFATAITQDLRTALAEAEEYTDEATWHLESAADADAVDRSRLSAWVSGIDDALERVAVVIEDILDHARGGPLEPDPRPADFGTVVDSAWETVEPPGPTLQVESGGEITADPDHLRRVLVELLRNAAGARSGEPSVADAPEDAVEHGSTSPASHAQQDAAGARSGEDVTVRVGLTDDGFYVAVDGSGVSADLGSTPVDARASSTEDGSGLGLSIAAQRASAQGWHLSRETTREGARFVVTDAETVPGRDPSSEVSE